MKSINVSQDRDKPENNPEKYWHQHDGIPCSRRHDLDEKGIESIIKNCKRLKKLYVYGSVSDQCMSVICEYLPRLCLINTAELLDLSSEQIFMDDTSTTVSSNMV